MSPFIIKENESEGDDDDLYDAPPTRAAAPRSLHSSLSTPPPGAIISQSPSPSQTSDKENQASRFVSATMKGKRSAMEPPVQTPSRTQTSKRQRLGESSTQGATTETSTQQRFRTGSLYDPDQDIEERRVLRAGIRELRRDLKGN
jgi:hypothetical protein